MDENLELYPRLVVEGADAALDFYTAAFGGSVTERHAGPDGKVVHAKIAAGPISFAVKDADNVDPAPSAERPATIIALLVTDAHATARRMKDGGAQVIFPVADHDYGDRAGRLRDPFGHVWMIAQRL
ncbi:MAG TPA: VOC family protein [Pseudonocardia sp.]|jgi:uncharacterized glyoxalase superfamily protein PhnB|nr:VOC family protein [Pseudonocardia sp.]